MDAMLRPLGAAISLAALFAVGACGDSGNDNAKDTVTASSVSAASGLCSAPPGDGDELLLQVASPEWRDQVIYMLMIDRFYDGEPGNNDQGADEYDRYKETHFTGGDIPGITEKLDYLQDLGATAIWMTPPVYNQWWSQEYKATGWHGYWATHFSQVDPHYGTLADYQRLSHELHCRDMYLIQDIVVNHVGNFYNYDGEYDPEDTAKNFFLIEEGHPTQEGPAQYPFNMINRLDPEHAAADIYHWTPPVFDYNDRYQELNYGLGTISDINTENPVVVKTFKEIYGGWIEQVGVDGFRIDTVMLVPPRFFEQFLHDDDGIYAQAKAIGKDNFITFGEVIGIAKPFDTAGEAKVTQYMDTETTKGLNSMLGYPLYFSLTDVVAGGKPTAELAFRLDAFMEEYEDPFMIPNFVDNHDTTRFLNSGSKAAFRQALGVVMTIPGIPIVLQGTEQGLMETRQTMFGPAYGSPEDNFKPDSDYFKYLQSLIALRKEHKVLTRGSMTQVASSEFGSGLLAYIREYEGETALVLVNTANHSIFAADIDTGMDAQQELTELYSNAAVDAVVTGADGTVSLRLPARAFLVLSDRGAVPAESDKSVASEIQITVDSELGMEFFAEPIPLTGTVSDSAAELMLVINGNLDKALPIEVSDDGRWSTTIAVDDFGTYRKQFQIFAPETGVLTDPVTYMTRLETPAFEATVDDPDDDARGPTGTYVAPKHRDADRQMEVTGVSVRGGGRGMELTLSVANLTDIWIPPNGFDNVAFSIFFDVPDRDGATALPLINADMPEGMNWNFGHFVNGWQNFTFSADGATREHRGDVLGAAKAVIADKAAKTIRIEYDGEMLGVDDWRGVTVYVTTWEVSGEATYRPIIDEPAAWTFSGAPADAPKVLDDIAITIAR